MSKNLVGAILAIFMLSVAVPSAFAEPPAIPEATTTNTTATGNTVVEPVVNTTPAPVIAPAQATNELPAEEPGALSDEEVGESIGAIIKAFQDKEYMVAIGLLLMLLCWGVREGLKALNKPLDGKVMPWVAFGISAVGAVGFGLANGQGWMDITLTAVTAAFMSMGSFDTIKAVATAVKPNKVAEEA
jgi:hypothetical protein